jgi:hypothetical protein
MAARKTERVNVWLRDGRAMIAEAMSLDRLETSLG